MRGNHEDLFLGYVDRGEYDLWAINGVYRPWPVMVLTARGNRYRRAMWHSYEGQNSTTRREITYSYMPVSAPARANPYHVTPGSVADPHAESKGWT